MTVSLEGLGETVGSGSYDAADVQFLLRPMAIEVTDVVEKERLIQSGQKHYSEMISHEALPGERHMSLYLQALERNGARMAGDIQALALALKAYCPGPSIVLVSFVRAGLPPAVLLHRALRDLGCSSSHYGISIIRDRGIDKVALEAIIQRHGADNIVFVDGWTGKGAIASELRRTLADDPRFPDEPRLLVLADPCGRAWLAASADDWVIPSGILGATVSGLISRTVWPIEGGLHGCMRCDHLAGLDVSRSFVQHIDALRREMSAVEAARPWSHEQQQTLQQTAIAVVETLGQASGITNMNRIKPGIAEATRAVLRRVPERVLVRDCNDTDVQLLLHLTRQAGIDVEEVGEMIAPYRAVTIIQRLGQ